MRQKLMHRLMQAATDVDLAALEHAVGMLEALAETHPAEVMMQKPVEGTASPYEVAATRLAPAVGAYFHSLVLGH